MQIISRDEARNQNLVSARNYFASKYPCSRCISEFVLGLVSRLLTEPELPRRQQDPVDPERGSAVPQHPGRPRGSWRRDDPQTTICLTPPRKMR